MNRDSQNELNIEIDAQLRIEYERFGDGPPLVLLHAFPLGNKMWQPQIEALQGEFSVIAPNARGFGGTTPFSTKPIDGGPSIAQMARDLNALLDALEINEPIILCGLSMGGYTALHFAHEYPQRVRGLVLCDTRASADDDETKAKREANIQVVREQGSWAFTEKMSHTLLGETTRTNDPELVKQVVEWGSDQQIGTIGDALAALRDRPDASGWLADIRVPTLLIFGAEDALAPPFVVEALQNGIAGSRLAVIEGAGHLPNIEQPEKFNAALLEFARSLG